MTQSITVEEYISELTKTENADSNRRGYTARELAKTLDHSVGWVREFVRSACNMDTVTVSWRRERAIDGRSLQVPVYLFRSPRKARSK